MIHVRLERSENGMLTACNAEGHSGYAEKGFDIVCSAVTVLIRTTVQVLSKTCGVELTTDASKRGFVSFGVKIIKLDSLLEQKLKTAEEFLETGLGAIQKEYPKHLELVIKTV